MARHTQSMPGLRMHWPWRFGRACGYTPPSKSWTGPASSPTLRSTSASRSSASSSTRSAWTWTKSIAKALGRANRPASNRAGLRPVTGRSRVVLAEDRFASSHPFAPPEPQPEPQRPEVGDSPEDDRGFGTGGRTGRARVVWYAHLREPASLEAELDLSLIHISEPTRLGM